MRKFYILLSGALLLSMQTYSQVQFERHADDPRVIFEQDFEATPGLTDKEAYIEWSTTPIDTILELEYYAKLGSSTPRSVDIYSEENATDWSIFMVRKDSVSSEHPETSSGVGIVLFNGVETSSSASEKANHVYDKDSYTIVNDRGEDADRNKAFEAYGETGGQSYFKYETGGIDATKISSSHYSTDTRSTKNYRRDLYVRGLDIEDESSYRLTFYIKTKKRNTWDPLFYADLMRGYHHQRAPFSMGYKSGKDFSFSMDEFEDGQWQKVTIMNYYINAHEADGYVIYKGDYSWTDDWSWRPSDAELAAAGKTLPAGEVLNYVKQPDKFFIRFSFATDSIEYSLDNLTLTKSWIGGCEYHNDIMRINLGYDTNLKDIVAENMKKTNVPAVELPNEDMKYITVWYLDQDGDPDKASDWKRMPIRSAEYHSDGYMYLFTQSYPNPSDPSKPLTLKFGDKKQVLVTFHNPTDKPELTLKYTGSLYPKPLDTAWVNKGKIVPDFYNEIAVPNPNITKGVTSIDGLPPIMSKAPYEDGSFGLPLETKTLKFKFTKKIKIDEQFSGQNTQNVTGVIAYFDDEVWEPTWEDETSSLVITRPDGFTSSLQGDHKIHIVHVKGLSGDEGDEVVYNYHFGDFATVPVEATEYTHSDWRSQLTDPSNAEGCLPPNTWVYNYDGKFAAGTGAVETTANVRLYLLANTGLDNCCFYVSPRTNKGNGKAKYSGNLYTIVNLSKAGNYTIKFKAAEWWNKESTPSSDVESHLYIYPKPSGDAKDYTFSTFSSVTGKVDLGSINPSTHVIKDNIKDVSTGTWPSGVETFEYQFNIKEAGDYVIEWCLFFPETISNSSNGLAIGNYTIGIPAVTDLSTKYVKNLNNAISAAETRLASVADKYKGPDYNALVAVVNENKSYKGNFPSKYDSIVACISENAAALGSYIDAFDKFFSTEEKVATKLASFTGDSAKYKEMTTYKDLQKHKNANVGLDPLAKTTAQLLAQIDDYEAEIKAIDDRMTLIGSLNDKIKEVKDLLDAKDARKDYKEYDDMADGYDVAVKFDAVTAEDKAITNAKDDLNAIKNVYVFRCDCEMARTRQIKELYNLADTLGYDFFGKKDSIRNLVFGLAEDEPGMNNLLREAVILQILKIYAENNPAKVEKMEGFDVSVLIPNYFLYNEAQEGRDMDKNSNGTWRIIKNKENTTAFPGWTVYSTGTLYPGQKALDWATEGHVFVGGLRYTGTTGYIKSTIAGLPQAYYSLDFDMGANNVSSSKSTSFFKAVTTTDTVEVAGTKFSVAKVVSVDDSIRVKDGSPMTISYTVTSGSSSDNVIVNGVILRLTNPDDKASYADLVAAQQTKVNGLITFVGAPVMKESVEYYNLGGMKINNPKSGEIIIRKTIRNGKVEVDKVLIK